MQYQETPMLRTFVRSLSLVAILAGTAAAAGDPLPAETGKAEASKADTKKVAKKKTSKKVRKKAARKAKKAKKAKKPAAARATP
jgi:hypothetical protein